MSNFQKGIWKPDTAQKALYQKPLFTLGKNYSQNIQGLIDYYQRTRPRNNNLPPAQAADAVLGTYLEQELLKYEEDQLPNKNPEFRYLVKEYRDGILFIYAYGAKSVEKSGGRYYWPGSLLWRS